ncbi:Uncharacterised protein [Mycobacteroides abscessus subsp. abscessus]|nr:Uncharacterised protein [Mycobacteroides abscessus subsp. abscessus]
MEPIEINAGAWYLRALRADERMDDRPALTSLGVDDADYVTVRAADWDSDRLYSWAVCEPTTAEMVAEVNGLSVISFCESLEIPLRHIRYMYTVWPN